METLTIELSTGGYLGIVAVFVSDPSLISSKHLSRYMPEPSPAPPVCRQEGSPCQPSGAVADKGPELGKENTSGAGSATHTRSHARHD
jgi:hypothetical protein